MDGTAFAATIVTTPVPRLLLLSPRWGIPRGLPPHRYRLPFAFDTGVTTGEIIGRMLLPYWSQCCA